MKLISKKIPIMLALNITMESNTSENNNEERAQKTEETNENEEKDTSS